jgi:hypothetical protein
MQTHSLLLFLHTTGAPMTREPMIKLPPDIASAYRARERDARELARTAAALATMKRKGRATGTRMARPIPLCIRELLAPPRWDRTMGAE